MIDRRKWVIQNKHSKYCLYLKAAFELLADEVEYDGVDAWVYSRQVYAEVIKHQQETSRQRQIWICVNILITIVLTCSQPPIRNVLEWKRKRPKFPPWQFGQSWAIRANRILVIYKFTMPHLGSFLLEQITALDVMLKVNHVLQNATQVKRKPADSKNQHQRKHSLRYLSSLPTKPHRISLLPCVHSQKVTILSASTLLKITITASKAYTGI